MTVSGFMRETAPVRMASLVGFAGVLVADSGLVSTTGRGLGLIVALICFPWGIWMDVAERRQKRRESAERAR